jgi:ribonuclease HII
LEIIDLHRLEIEKQLWNKGNNFIAGIDEVGRGPLAGPVFACAVIFKRDFFLKEVRDSKKTSSQQRECLAPLLQEMALSWAIGTASVQEIDQINIRQATFLAMRRAVESLKIKPDYLLVDGENLTHPPYNSMGVIHGDQISFTIGAASIIAKVERDNFMMKLDDSYPYYKFAKNKGYGTAEHIKILKQIGPSPQHRISFLTRILNGKMTEER